MSAAQTVSKYLPFLRRYARALTGSQASGDAYVAATLETLIKEPDLLNSASQPKVALFRVFSSIWNSVPVNGAKEAASSSIPAERRISHLTPRPRQAFLLVSLEGFSDDAAAEILGEDLQSFRTLVDEAGRELAAEIATDVLIIEDETFIALDLEGLAESLGHHVVGIARTHAEAVKLAKSKKPGLILADIQLADGSSGLDAVNELLDEFEVPVDLHHGLSGAVPHRSAPRAGVPDRQAVPARDRFGGRQPSLVLPAQCHARPPARDGLILRLHPDLSTSSPVGPARGRIAFTFRPPTAGADRRMPGA